MMMQHLLGGHTPDSYAKSQGFPDAATMAAYQEKQKARFNGASSGGASVPSDSGSILDTIFSIHPSVLLHHVLNVWNKADGSN
jgi:hypothetical protein